MMAPTVAVMIERMPGIQLPGSDGGKIPLCRAIQPPSQAPTRPNTRVKIHPPFSLPGDTSRAMAPAIKPSNPHAIHWSMPELSDFQPKKHAKIITIFLTAITAKMVHHRAP